MSERLKPRDEWTVDEILNHARTGEVPEAEGYREARLAALEAAGLEPRPEDLPPLETDEQSVQDHLTRQQERGN